MAAGVRGAAKGATGGLSRIAQMQAKLKAQKAQAALDAGQAAPAGPTPRPPQFTPGLPQTFPANVSPPTPTPAQNLPDSRLAGGLGPLPPPPAPTRKASKNLTPGNRKPLTPEQKLESLKQRIWSATTEDTLSATHPRTIKGLTQELTKLSPEDFDLLTKGLGPDGTQRLDRLAEMAWNDTKFGIETDVAQAYGDVVERTKPGGPPKHADVAARVEAARDRVARGDARFGDRTPQETAGPLRDEDIPTRPDDAAREEAAATEALESRRVAGPRKLDRDDLWAALGTPESRELQLAYKTGTPNRKSPDPLETRTNAERPVGGTETNRIERYNALVATANDSTLPVAERQAAHEELNSFSAPTKTNKYHALVRIANDSTLPMAERQAAMKALGKMPSPTAMTDNKLAAPTQRQAYDTAVGIGQRPHPQDNIARSNDNFSRREAADNSYDVHQQMGFDRDGVAVPSGLRDGEGPLTPHAGRGNLGGRPHFSQEADALDRLFSNKYGSINPFDIRLFRGNASAIAEDLLNGNTTYKPGTADWEMAREDLARAITRRFEGPTAPGAKLRWERKPDAEPVVAAPPADAPTTAAVVDAELPEVTGTPLDATPEDANLAASAVDMGPDVDDAPAFETAAPVVETTKRKGRGKKSAAAVEDEAIPEVTGEPISQNWVNDELPDDDVIDAATTDELGQADDDADMPTQARMSRPTRRRAAQVEAGEDAAVADIEEALPPVTGGTLNEDEDMAAGVKGAAKGATGAAGAKPKGRAGAKPKADAKPKGPAKPKAAAADKAPVDDVEEKLDNAAVDVGDGTAAPDKNWDDKWPGFLDAPIAPEPIKNTYPGFGFDGPTKPKPKGTPKPTSKQQEPIEAEFDPKPPGTWKEWLWRHRYGLGAAGGVVGGAAGLRAINSHGDIEIPEYSSSPAAAAPSREDSDAAEIQRLRARLERSRNRPAPNYNNY